MMSKSVIALSLAVLLLSASGHIGPALAVDNVTSNDAPDLTSVRAKIEAKDFKGALAELTPMLETHQHADVYNLMGFSLRKTGDLKQAYTFYRRRWTSIRSIRARLNIWVSSMSKPARSTRPGRMPLR